MKNPDLIAENIDNKYAVFYAPTQYVNDINLRIYFL